jgi:kinesin family member C2/C3
MYGLIIAVAQCEDLKLKCYEEMDKRKKLYNIVQETKGIHYPVCIQFFVLTLNIYLRECILYSHSICLLNYFRKLSGFFCRCRPLSKNEVSSSLNANGGTTKKTFKFDRVFTPKDDQGILVIT